MKNQFVADGHSIVFDDIGDGDPIILLHGFGADRFMNWRLTGWYAALKSAGYRVIAPDARGHGQSDKPLSIDDYAPDGIAGDVIRLMDHLDIDRANVFGYSMGARNAAWLLTRHDDRLENVVIAGAGINVLETEDAEYWERRGFNLTADNRQSHSLARPWLRPLMRKVNELGGMPGALSACLLGSFAHLPADDFRDVTTPTLVIAGEKDTVAGSPVPLAESIPGASAVVVPGKTHLTALTDSYFKGAVLGFLGHRWPLRQSA